MAIIPFLPSIIVLLLIVATVTLFIFWLGQPSIKKLKMAQLSLGYLFFLNALLAVTTNVMVFKDPASVEKSPLSLLMMLLPLGVGVLLYRAGCKRQAEIPAEQAIKAGSKTGKPSSGKKSKWKVIDNTAEQSAASRGSSTSGTWVLVLFLISALAYAPAMFMLDSKDTGGASQSSSVTSPVATPEPAPSPAPQQREQEEQVEQGKQEEQGKIDEQAGQVGHAEQEGQAERAEQAKQDE